MPVAIRRDAVQQLLAHVERCHAEVGVEPLVATTGEEVHAFVLEVRVEHPDRLDRIRIQVSAARVRDLGQPLEVLAIAVAVRDPRHRDEPGAGVAGSIEIGQAGGAVVVRNDAELDAQLLLEFAIQQEAGLEMQVIDDDIVAGLQLQPARDDVFTGTGGLDETHFPGVHAEQAGELPAHALLPFAQPEQRLRVGLREGVEQLFVEVGDRGVAPRPAER